MDKTITQEDVEKVAEKYVYERQKIRHYAKSEEDATMRDFDKTLKAWDAYDMEQSFEAGAAYALGKQTATITQEEIESHSVGYATDVNNARLSAYPEAMRPQLYPEYDMDDLANAFEAGANFAIGKQEKDADEQEVFTCEKSKVLYRFRMAEACKIGNNPESDYWIGYSKAIQDLFGFEGEPYVTPNDADTVIQGWVARDESGDLYMYIYKPKKISNLGYWDGDVADVAPSNNLFPDLTWESDPEPVEIIIKRKKNGNDSTDNRI